MNKKKQQSVARKNRIRTKKAQANAKRDRERRGLLLDLNKIEENERAKNAQSSNVS